MRCYQTHFFKKLANIFNNIKDAHPDMTLLCIEDGVKLQCHRIILSACSDYFENLFNWNNENVIEVHNGITGETLETILNYVYSGEISLTLENVCDQLVAANYFTIEEIVDKCIHFILDNLEINNAMDMFIFSWQLDLSKLINGTVSFVANHFSYILKDPNSSKQLLSLPVHLMVEILKSNGLILRDELTELPTRPVQREKLILKFILQYIKILNNSFEAITPLLSCVKWPLLNYFREKQFVFTKFATILDNGKRKDEVERFFDVKHSDWLVKSSENCIPTAEDISMYSTRIFSCSELLSLGPMIPGNDLEYTGMAGTTPKPFTIIAKENERLVKLGIIMSNDDDGVEVCGISLYFASVGNNKCTHYHVGLLKEDGSSIHIIDLEGNEHITRVDANKGKITNSLLFETSKMRVFGPYGNEIRGENKLMKIVDRYREEGIYYPQTHTYKYCKSVDPGPHLRVPLDSILVGIVGITPEEETSGVELGVRDLTFIFRQLLPSSQLVSTEKEFEEILYVSNQFW